MFSSMPTLDRSRLRSEVGRLLSFLPELGIHVASPAMRRFWMLLTHYHGQMWSAAAPARSRVSARSAIECWWIESAPKMIHLRLLIA
ncbi:MAG TPA: hypothetical protein VFZ28_19195 [Burkholderiaceae bacterium]|nr:hypothetical protein [Burkholderiaceae bacterium]